MRRISICAAVLAVVMTGGCSLLDLSYDSRSSEYKEDSGTNARLDTMERRLDRLEQELGKRR